MPYIGLLLYRTRSEGNLKSGILNLESGFKISLPSSFEALAKEELFSLSLPLFFPSPPQHPITQSPHHSISPFHSLSLSLPLFFSSSPKHPNTQSPNHPISPSPFLSLSPSFFPFPTPTSASRSFAKAGCIVLKKVYRLILQHVHKLKKVIIRPNFKGFLVFNKGGNIPFDQTYVS